MMAHDQGDLGEAARLYQESLRLSTEANTYDVIVNTIHQLGLLEQDRKNYLEALDLYNQSLKMSEQLGDRTGIAISLHQIANLYFEQGNISQALKYYIRSWEQFINLGTPEAAHIEEDLKQIWQLVDRRKFDAWLTEAYGKQADEIRAKLAAAGYADHSDKMVAAVDAG